MWSNDANDDLDTRLTNLDPRDELDVVANLDGTVGSWSLSLLLLSQLWHDDKDDIMMSIFTYLPIKEQAKNKLVCKKWESLNTQSIEQSPKQAFETTKELRKAVLVYCNQGGYLDGSAIERIHAPTTSQREMVSRVYGSVINDWNVSKIEVFDYLFSRCENFNANINSWNTSNAKSMTYMFHEATSFNQPLNEWNTLNVKEMRGVFKKAASFNQPVNAWNTSNVWDMSFMFKGASSFNQPLNGWNTSHVQSMVCMFDGASAFSYSVDMWDTSAIVTPNRMPFAP